MKALLYPALLMLALVAPASGQLTLTGTSYSQDFNGIGSGLPTGWGVYTGASSSSQGTAGAFSGSAVSWATTTGGFRNVASATGLTSLSDATAQSNSTDRALGIRQTAAFGDPGASFQLNFVSTGLNVTSLSVDLMMLSVQTYSTTWSLQWSADGIAWSTLDTWADTGTFGSTTKSFSEASLSGLSNLSNGYFRVAALTAATGTGSRDTIGIDNFSLTYTVVPEPSTYALLFGVCALGFVGYRRFRTAHA